MTPQDRDRLDVISAALAQMVIRQRALEARLTRLEESVGTAALLIEAVPPPEVPPDALHEPGAPQPEDVRKAPEPAPRPPVGAPAFSLLGQPPPPLSLSRQQGVESAVGLTWISRIGALTLVIGVAFFFKYAFENHWITEAGRVLLGVACAAALLGTGEWLWRGMQRTYAQALTAAGVAFLYLSFWAAFVLYHLIGQTAAAGLMAVTTAGACLLAVRYGSGAVAALGLSGGYLTPLLLETGHAPWFVLGYAILLSAGAMRLSFRWRWLEPLALVGASALYSTQGSPYSGERLGFTLLTLALYGVFACSRTQAVAAAAQVLAGMAVANTAGPELISFAPRLAAAGCGLAVAHRRGWTWMAPAAFAGFWLADVRLGQFVPLWGTFVWLTLAMLVFLAWPVWRGLSGATLRSADLLLLALNAAVYYGAGYKLLDPLHLNVAGLFTVAVALPHMGAALLLWDRDRRGGLLAAATAWVLLVAAVPVQFTGYRVTAAWSLEAAGLAWMSARLRDRRAAIGSLLVFLLALGRLVLVDSWIFRSVDYTPLWNARFVTAAVTALALWGSARWINGKEAAEKWAAASAYLGGHFAMVWGLCLEVAGWSVRSAAPENAGSVRSLSISILLAAYALALVAGGVAKRSALNRIPGIALIGFVVVKLYLYDVWSLGLFYRMAAFAVLGVLLLAMSYLYSRFRATIESWWRPE